MKMKEKHYFTQAVGTDSNGVEHKIVVCGVWNQLKEKVEVSNDVVLEFGVRGKILHPKTILCKSFSMGYAICSPEDEFSLEEGKKIALSRAKKKPIGKLGTLDFSMLNEDQCQALIFAEALHITKNIDSYIVKRKSKVAKG